MGTEVLVTKFNLNFWDQQDDKYCCYNGTPNTLNQDKSRCPIPSRFWERFDLSYTKLNWNVHYYNGNPNTFNPDKSRCPTPSGFWVKPDLIYTDLTIKDNTLNSMSKRKSYAPLRRHTLRAQRGQRKMPNQLLLTTEMRAQLTTVQYSGNCPAKTIGGHRLVSVYRGRRSVAAYVVVTENGYTYLSSRNSTLPNYDHSHHTAPGQRPELAFLQVRS